MRIYHALLQPRVPDSTASTDTDETNDCQRLLTLCSSSGQVDFPVCYSSAGFQVSWRRSTSAQTSLVRRLARRRKRGLCYAATTTRQIIHHLQTDVVVQILTMFYGSG